MLTMIFLVIRFYLVVFVLTQDAQNNTLQVQSCVSMPSFTDDATCIICFDQNSSQNERKQGKFSSCFTVLKNGIQNYTEDQCLEQCCISTTQDQHKRFKYCDQRQNMVTQIALIVSFVSASLLIAISIKCCYPKQYYSYINYKNRRQKNIFRQFCCICEKRYTNIKTVQCKHYYHSKCLKWWQLRMGKSLCGYCYASIETASMICSKCNRQVIDEIKNFPDDDLICDRCNQKKEGSQQMIMI